MAASTKSQTTATSKSSKKVPMAQQPQTKLTGWKLWVGLVLLLIGGLGLFMGQSALWISSTIFNQKTFVETTNKVPPMITSLISII